MAQWTEAQDLMRITLAVAVPMRIEQINARGGPTDLDWQELKDVAEMIAHHGDTLQYSSSKQGVVAKQFTALARALAILSFVPGGVRFADMHWELVTERPQIQQQAA